MKRARIAAAGLLVLLAGSEAVQRGTPLHASSAIEPVTIPFELAARHVIVKVTVNRSRPLSFVLDTGANAAIIRTDVARELGLKLEGAVTVRGAGPGTQQGSLVRGASWSLVGGNGFSQPVTLALPMPGLSPALGQPLDGIIGGEFIKQFVVELDYEQRMIRLHEPASFVYHGPGEILSIEFRDVTHPVVTATVTPVGGQPLERQFLLDIGAGLPLALHSPFVAEQSLLGPSAKTIRAIGGAGAGGKTTGRIGRVESLKIGSFTITSPITLFSQDQAGAFANAALAGNIGAQIAMRFRAYFDYGRRRIILEPSKRFGEPFDRAFSGLALHAQGVDYRTFVVMDVLEESPATDAGIQIGDVIESVDQVPAARLTMSTINDMFEKPLPYALTIRRGQQTIKVTLTPRRLI
jgi:aspartyl protease/PDZ domain-containing protein